LANTGSLLLPVSNLTNLLAFAAAGISFGRFAALMAVPWLVACTAERVGLGRFFRSDLDGGIGRGDLERVHPPVFALMVLGLTLAGIVLTSSLHVAPAWAALAGCLALLTRDLYLRRGDLRAVVLAANPGFCLFVLALAVVVDGVTRHGLGQVLGDIVPSGDELLPMLGIVAVAAVLSNVVNNLPATLALVPIVAGSPTAVLAMLVGVNIGPNATYAGSLATLLWRRIVPEADRPDTRTFHQFGLATVPAVLLLTTVTLWVATRVLGT
jgi:arsenical pump membrane protein